MPLIPITERGRRMGESHPHARYPDEMVELVRALYDAGKSYGQICQALGLPKSTVRDFVQYKRRACTIAAWKKIKD